MKQLSAREALEAQDSGAIVLDVRELEERAAGFVPGSLHIPLQSLPERFGELPEGAHVICQCMAGGRSAAAAQFLSGRGWQVSNLAGGILAWQSAGLPLASS